VGLVVTWVLLAALWIGLSGFFDPIHLAFGFVSVTLVSLLSHRHLTGGDEGGTGGASGGIALGVMRIVRLALYAPWLLWQIVVANFDVALRVIGFREIDPVVIRFKPELTSDFGLVTLANSITLTPGTVTVDIEGGEFIIHAITQEAADAVIEGTMARKVRGVEGVG